LPDDDQWIDADQLTLLEELGRGAFGVGMQHSIVVFAGTCVVAGAVIFVRLACMLLS
jgi:hypothetical protein